MSEKPKKTPRPTNHPLGAWVAPPAPQDEEGEVRGAGRVGPRPASGSGRASAQP
jgi:hypothetical protein